MDRQGLARVLVTGGAVLLVIGVVLWLTDPDDDGRSITEVSSSVPASPTSSTTSSSSSSTTSSTTSSSSSSTTSSSTTSSTSSTTSSSPPSAEEESVEEFLAVLDAGLASDDIAGALFDRLHQATIERYGADACRSYLAGLPPQEPGLRLREVGPPGPWRYETDGIARTMPEAIAVEVDRVVGGQTIIQELHWALVDGRYRWFTDCGEPLPRA